MIQFFKKLFGAKPAETVAEVPYKVEVAPAVVVAVEPAVNPVVSTTGETVVVADVKPAPKKKAGNKPKPQQRKSNKPKAPKAPKAP